MKKITAISITSMSILGIIFFLNLFRAPSSIEKREIFTIDTNTNDVIALKLQNEGFIKSFSVFNIAKSIKGNKDSIEPGSYYLSKNMSTWRIIDELSQGPDLKQIIILEGMRKEQIGEKLQSTFRWNDSELRKWNNIYTTKEPEYKEGVYFPDTYLIPIDETGEQIAQRMINNFNDKFSPYSDQFKKKNIKWTTALKIASIIQRESAGESDMKLISGILWNRLLEGQKLDIDATIQYAKGKTNGKWWSQITGSDIQNIDSLYNTYKYAGLPPSPIANPGLAAIKAVLNPEKTDCFYYLHDRSRQIHCAKTYEEHLRNIEEYLN